MSGSRIIAPFVVCAVIAAALPPLDPVNPLVLSPAVTLTASVRPSTSHHVDSAMEPSSHSRESSANPSTEDIISGGSFGLGLVDVLSVMQMLVANNPTLASTMHNVSVGLLEELAQGKPLGEAMVDVILQVSDSFDGDLGTVVQTGLGQISRIWSLAPGVVSGVITVAAALPNAVAPVVRAVATAVVNVAAALGSDRLTAVVAAGLNDVMTAAGKGILTMVGVVHNVVQDVEAVLAGGSGSTAAVRAAASASDDAARTNFGSDSRTPTKAATGARPKLSASVPAAAEKRSAGSQSAGSPRASGKRATHSGGIRATARSAR